MNPSTNRLWAWWAVCGGIAASLIAAAATAGSAEPVPRPRAPFKVLFSNDTTNITSCVSPYHRARQQMTDDMIRATVEEAAGVDVHMLQPGMGWIPWWKSQIYPGDAHYRFYRDEMHVAADVVDRHPYAVSKVERAACPDCLAHREKGAGPLF